jgi:NADH-quinone oxidoreductase subunit M
MGAYGLIRIGLTLFPQGLHEFAGWLAVFAAINILWMLKRVFYGPFNQKWNWLPYATLRETIPLLVLAAIIVLVGVYPKVLIDIFVPSLTQILHGVGLALTHP